MMHIYVSPDLNELNIKAAHGLVTYGARALAARDQQPGFYAVLKTDGCPVNPGNQNMDWA